MPRKMLLSALIVTMLTCLTLSAKPDDSRKQVVDTTNGGKQLSQKTAFEHLLALELDQSILASVPLINYAGRSPLTEAGNRQKTARILILMARAFDFDQNPVAASQLYQQANLLDPQNTMAIYGLADTLLRTGKWDEAHKIFLSLEPQAANDYIAARACGIWALYQHDYSRAINCFRQSISLKPTSASGHFLLARAMMSAGQIKSALAQYRLAAKHEASPYVKELIFGTIADVENKPAEAKEHYLKAGKILPGDPTWHYRLSGNAGPDQSRALAELTAAVNSRRVSSKSFIRICWLLSEAVRMDDAKKCLDYLERLQPGSADVLIARAGLLSRERNYELAEAQFERALALNPCHLWGFNSLASMNRERESPDKVHQTYKRLTEACPKYWQGWRDLADSHRRAKRWKEAIPVYEMAKAVGPQELKDLHDYMKSELSQVHSGLGLCHYKLESTQRAQQAAIAFNQLKFIPPPRAYLEWVLLRPGRLDFNRSAGSAEHKVVMHTALADVLYEENELTSCCEQYRKAITIAPDDIDLHFYLFHALIKNKDVVEAMKEDLVLANKIVGRAPRAMGEWTRNLEKMGKAKPATSSGASP